MATTALTAAVSTGLVARTSSRATYPRHRHTSAAAAMQANTAAARIATITERDQHASASPAASRIWPSAQPVRHGAKKGEGECLLPSRRFVLAHLREAVPSRFPSREPVLTLPDQAPPSSAPAHRPPVLGSALGCTSAADASRRSRFDQAPTIISRSVSKIKI
jgi:hypothetical protein